MAAIIIDSCIACRLLTACKRHCSMQHGNPDYKCSGSRLECRPEGAPWEDYAGQKVNVLKRGQEPPAGPTPPPQAATPPAPSPTLTSAHASVPTPPHPAATPSHPPANPTPAIAPACPRPPRHSNAPLPTNRPAPHHCPLPGMFAPQQAGSVQPLTDARLGSGSLERPPPSMPLWSPTGPQPATQSTPRSVQQDAPQPAADSRSSEARSAASPQLGMHPHLTEAPGQVQADRCVFFHPGRCVLCCICLRLGYAVGSRQPPASEVGALHTLPCTQHTCDTVISLIVLSKV